MNALKIPQYHELMWPALQATKELGGSATVHEMNERAMASAGISEEQQAVPHGEDSRMSEVAYRLHWARTHIKGIGALENSARGVWAVTDRGRSMSEQEMRTATKAWRDSFRERRVARRDGQAAGAGDAEEEGEVEGGWKDQLIARLLQLPPDGFERLAQRILREAGFVNVTVTGKSGDGGIDGAGTYRLSLVSFPVYFQCKRYKGTVTPGAVRDFRGAMAGRGEKGLLEDLLLDGIARSQQHRFRLRPAAGPGNRRDERFSSQRRERLGQAKRAHTKQHQRRAAVRRGNQVRVASVLNRAGRAAR